MKYYLHYKNNEVIGCSNCLNISDGIDKCKEVSKEEFDSYMRQVEDNITQMRDKEARINAIKTELTKLSEDFTQYMLGAEFKDIEDRKQKFRDLHNELRSLENKEPRIYNNINK